MTGSVTTSMTSPVTIEVRILELLASKLCHDLVSPVGAIRNGLELIEEMREDAEADPVTGAALGQGFLGEAVALIDHSSNQADRRLRVFRLAYGAAGREQRGFADARDAAAGWIDGGRSALDWPERTPDPALGDRRGVAKLLLNMVVLAEEALPYGGRIAVAGEGDATAGRVTVTATGRPGGLSAELAAALVGAPTATLTPRSVHAYVTGRFAEDAGLRLAATPSGADRLIFSADW
ncbi:histidine phosphotransferase family protein [Azospirillum cavernae]|uniref:histidine phosphotransferase family protein n=1 Tax=Azospirillum cavernae TaxID=2320860 RepID=UPI001EE54340|nr:histidine phosphotransferase family protein [Azospirillum cavernae]